MTALPTGTAGALGPAASATAVPLVMPGATRSTVLAAAGSAIILGIINPRRTGATAPTSDDHAVTQLVAILSDIRSTAAGAPSRIASRRITNASVSTAIKAALERLAFSANNYRKRFSRRHWDRRHNATSIAARRT
jgi:hypothetical protein